MEESNEIQKKSFFSPFLSFFPSLFHLHAINKVFSLLTFPTFCGHTYMAKERGERVESVYVSIKEMKNRGESFSLSTLYSISI